MQIDDVNDSLLRLDVDLSQM